MRKAIDLTGCRFNRLLALTRIPNRGRTRWLCTCDCGAVVEVDTRHLRTGSIKSCGCFRREIGTRTKTHGDTHSAEYLSWDSMKSRCTNSRHKCFYLYGGRGIKVCRRWLKYENFLADMGRRPSPEHSIDRIDNGKGYSPENCRWATRIEQANNKRNNRLLTHNGVELGLTQWARLIGMGMTTLSNRIHSGWTVDRALTEPVKGAKA